MNKQIRRNHVSHSQNETIRTEVLRPRHFTKYKEDSAKSWKIKKIKKKQNKTRLTVFLYFKMVKDSSVTNGIEIQIK